MILIVLPAYNEAAGLPPLLNEIRAVMNESRLEYKVVVVDDGSSDATWETIGRHAQEMPIVPVRHEVNRGLAEALRSGLQVALAQAAPTDVIVTMDADNTHAPGPRHARCWASSARATTSSSARATCPARAWSAFPSTAAC